MAETITIARPYAEAVFKLAVGAGTLGKWSEMLQFLAVVVADSEVAAIIDNPEVEEERLQAFLLSVAEGKLDEHGQNLVKVLLENGRLVLLPQIRELFEQLKAEQGGELEAEISSAFPLTDAQAKALASDLEVRFGKKVTTKINVDADLIGGVKIAIGDHVIDSSVRAQLASMAQQLKN
jgi:F-type H+-transporting ATPase subunit delta